MTTLYWLGTADAVVQIGTASIDSVDATPANNLFIVTIGGVAISTLGDTNVATTAAALVVLLEASTHPYFTAITWTNPSAGNIVATADTAGIPFIAALTETGVGSAHAPRSTVRRPIPRTSRASSGRSGAPSAA